MLIEQPLFIERRVRDAIGVAASVAELHGERSAVARLTGLEERLQRKAFNVAILGEFKRGKSTFVNALLGGEILPTGVLPLTSILTRVAWGERPAVTISFEAEPPRTLGLEALRDYVTEVGNPANRLGVTSAEVNVPSPLLRAGVVLIDTPGVGSTHEHNTDTTLALLPDVDAAVFLTATNPPISEGERRFLRAVRSHAAKIFFVVNKTEVLEAGERDEVLSFTRDVIAEAVGATVNVYGVSALDALAGGDEGMARFAEDFTEFLHAGLARSGMVSVAIKTAEVVAQLRAGVSVELESLQLSEQEVLRRRDAVADVVARTEVVRGDLAVLVQHELSRTVAVVDQALGDWRVAAAQQLSDVAERAVTGSDASPGDLDEVVERSLRSDVGDTRPGLEALALETFTGGTVRLVAQARDHAESARRACSDILKLSLPPLPSFEDLDGRSRFTFSFFRAPTLVGSLLPPLPTVLPKRRGQRLALSRVQQRIPRLVDAHAGRMRYDLVQRLEDTARNLTRTLDAHLRGTLEGLQLALARAVANIEEHRFDRVSQTDVLIALEEELFMIADSLWDAVRDLQDEPGRDERSPQG